MIHYWCNCWRRAVYLETLLFTFAGSIDRACGTRERWCLTWKAKLLCQTIWFRHFCAPCLKRNVETLKHSDTRTFQYPKIRELSIILLPKHSNTEIYREHQRYRSSKHGDILNRSKLKHSNVLSSNSVESVSSLIVFSSPRSPARPGVNNIATVATDSRQNPPSKLSRKMIKLD